ncbi:MAG: hypothetical protein RL645_1102 [Actinomycetota bacterium]|jgi:hypothetical protein
MKSKIAQIGIITGSLGLFFIIISALMRGAVDRDHEIRGLGCLAFFSDACSNGDDDYVPANIVAALGVIALVAGIGLFIAGKFGSQIKGSMLSTNAPGSGPSATSSATGFCTSCGTASTGTKFCGSCGAQMG